MICLDTNYLILGLIEGSKESEDLIKWATHCELLVTPMAAWFEFLCGPVSIDQISTMRAFLHEILVFDEPQAIESARLFNAVKRKRSLRIDAMIAGAATTSGAQLATNNRIDFENFVPAGLELV